MTIAVTSAVTLPTYTLYGIPNCDQVKKARAWLDAHQISYRFHDYKKLGIDRATLTHWLAHTSLEQLINRQGTTWRKLDDATRAACNQTSSALPVLIQQPSLIKRPVLVVHNQPNETEIRLQVGFNPAGYETLR